MKKLYSILLALFLFQFSNAQVNLPHTLVFTTDDPLNWADGIAGDGEGGSSNINGFDFQIYTTTSGGSIFPGSTIWWNDNDYFSSNNPAFHGITSGPDLYATNNGVPAMVFKNTNPNNNFSLESIHLYDWGGYSPVVIETYDNGNLVGSIEVEFDMVNYDTKTISQSDELVPSTFSNIDEIRFLPKSPNTVFNLSFNEISIGLPHTILPVKLEFFTGRFDDNNQNVVLEWATSSEENNSHFEIEKSTDGLEFSFIGRVEARSASSTRNLYKFLHAAGTNQVWYFRLRQVDLDGKATMSSIVRLSSERDLSIIATPNPTSGKFNILPGRNNVKSASLFNVAGIRVMIVKDLSLQNNQMDISSLPPGVYILHLETNSRMEKLKIIKQ